MNNKLRQISIALTLLLLPLLYPAAARAAGPFSESGVGFLGLRNGAAAWGDYDNDGYLDLVVTASTNSGNVAPYISQIWRNNGDSTFSNINVNLGPHTLGAVAWADLDNDGYLDLILTGKTNSAASDYSTEVWRNLGGTNFLRIPNNLPAGSLGSIAVADFNNDGRLDIVVIGPEIGVSTAVYRNGGSFGFSATDMPTFENPGRGFAQFGDTDNDGWLDLFVAGLTTSSTRIAKLYRNLNGLALTNTVTLPGAGQARGGFGDYNNDGRLDLLTAATSGSATNAHVWYNNGIGEFLESGAVFYPVPVPSSGSSATVAAWGDYDNDGLSDIFLVWLGREPWIFHNNHDGTFSDIHADFPFPFGSFSLQVGIWGDFNNDGKLDLLISVSDPDVGYLLYRNDTAISNTPPAAPSGLTYELSPGGTNITLHWLAASDAQTSADGLSYNIRVGTTPGGCDVVSPMANAATGQRRIPALGNAQLRRFAFLRNLSLGTTYYWSVQAIDTAFAGGAWSPEVTFTTRIPLVGDTDGDGVVSKTEFDAVLGNYLANSPYLRVTNTAGLGGTNVTFALTNDIAGTFSVEYSTNLVDWQFLGPATPRYLFTDPAAPAIPQRSYRLRWP